MGVFNSIAIIGAGAWGTALAAVAARAGREVTLYARDAAAARQIAASRTNPKLPGVALAAEIAITSDLARAAECDVILLVTPAQALRDSMTALAPHLTSAKPVVACAKGIERGSHKFMTEIIAETAPL